MTNYLANVTRPAGDPQVLQSGRSSLSGVDQLARALGWFSIGLGAMELLAPRALLHTMGMRKGKALLRAYGIRELGAGLMTLSVDKGDGLRGRIAGDALDLATLMMGLRRRNPRRGTVRLALAMTAGITLLDILTAQALPSRGRATPPRYNDRSGFPQGIESARGIATNAGR